MCVALNVAYGTRSVGVGVCGDVWRWGGGVWGEVVGTVVVYVWVKVVRYVGWGGGVCGVGWLGMWGGVVGFVGRGGGVLVVGGMW